MTRLTFVPPSLEAQTNWLDWVREVAFCPGVVDAGANAWADVNAQLPTRSTVKIHTLAGMSRNINGFLQTCKSFTASRDV